MLTLDDQDYALGLGFVDATSYSLDITGVPQPANKIRRFLQYKLGYDEIFRTVEDARVALERHGIELVDNTDTTDESTDPNPHHSAPLTREDQAYALALGFVDATSDSLDITGVPQPANKIRRFLQYKLGYDEIFRTVEDARVALERHGIDLVDSSDTTDESTDPNPHHSAPLTREDQAYAKTLGFANTTGRWLEITGMRNRASTIRRFLHYKLGVDKIFRTEQEARAALLANGIYLVDLEADMQQYGKLDALNNALRQLGERPQPSVTQARMRLHQFNINIFDFIAGTPRAFKTKQDLLADLRYRTGYYPLLRAKESTQHRCLLKHFAN